MLLSAVEEGGACKVSDDDELQMVQNLIKAEESRDFGSSAAAQSEILKAYEFDTLADEVFADGNNNDNREKKDGGGSECNDSINGDYGRNGSLYIDTKAE